MERITLEGESAIELRVGRARRPTACLVFMPSADCDARRYDWLGALADTGICVGVVDASCGGKAPGVVATSADLMRAVDHMTSHAPTIVAAGHSRGGATILDALDAGALGDDALASVAVLGCSLEAEVLGKALPHLSEDRRLRRPSGLPLLFIGGDHDRLASPERMDATRRRYSPPTQQLVMRGATHYGWAEKPAAADWAAYDAPGEVDLPDQRVRTLSYLAQWIRDGSIHPIAGDVVTRS